MRSFTPLWTLYAFLCAGTFLYLLFIRQTSSGKAWMATAITAAVFAVIIALAQWNSVRALRAQDGTVQVFSDERSRAIQGGVTYETAPSISVDIQDRGAELSISKDHEKAVLEVRNGKVSLRGNEYGGVRTGDLVQVTDDQLYVNGVERRPIPAVGDALHR